MNRINPIKAIGTVMKLTKMQIGLRSMANWLNVPSKSDLIDQTEEVVNTAQMQSMAEFTSFRLVILSI